MNKQKHIKPRNSEKQNSKEKKGGQNQELSEYLKGELTKICQQATSFLRERLHNVMADSPLSEQDIHGLKWDMEDKLRFFKSKTGDKANYYCNYGMLLFGVNKGLMVNRKLSLHDFIKSISPAVAQLSHIEGYRLELERGGYLLFKLEQAKTN